MLNELSFIDAVSIVSFLVGLENLELNITQEDFQRLLTEIHGHLEMQDEKIDEILRRLE